MRMIQWMVVVGAVGCVEATVGDPCLEQADCAPNLDCVTSGLDEGAVEGSCEQPPVEAAEERIGKSSKNMIQ